MPAWLPAPATQTSLVSIGAGGSTTYVHFDFAQRVVGAVLRDAKLLQRQHHHLARAGMLKNENT